MKADLSQIVKEAMEAPLAGFNKTVEDATQLLRDENAKVGNLEIIGRFVRMEPSGEAVIIGDLHGDLESLVHILQESSILQRMDKSDSVHLVFLGDYGDRGDFFFRSNMHRSETQASFSGPGHLDERKP